MTLATAPKVPPRVSNELLARKAVVGNLKDKLGAWLQEIGLARYEAALLQWCTEMGAATPEEISENAADAARAIENSSVEEREQVEQVLARAGNGKLCVDALPEPLLLVGRIAGWRRGGPSNSRRT